jgi:Ca-activated chloride channel family protein
MVLPELHLLRPAWLLALIPLALGLWRLSRSSGGAAIWQALVDTHLLPHLLVGADSRVQRLPLLLLAVAGVTAALALAGPVWERLPQPAYQAAAARVIVLDISGSMNAADLPPSRLAHARFEILDLLQRFREGQTALLAYGAEPFVVSPLTTDAKTIAAQVPELSTDLLPVHGPKHTGKALEEAGRLLHQAGAPRGQVILITDGLDHPAATLDAARKLHKQGYRLSVMGMGTIGGAPVPAPGGGFRQGSSGVTQLAKLDETALRTLAATAGGHYVRATPDDRDIEALVRDAPVDRRAVTDKAESARADQWREEGPWLLLVLLPLAAAAFRRGWVSPLLLAILLVQPPPAEAFSWSDLWLRPDQQAARLLEQGNARDAADTFQRPDWRAAAAYEAGDFKNTLQTLNGMDSPAAWYNRGNALARLGTYDKALTAYDQALAENPDDADARHNRDLVRRLLEQQQQSPNGQTQSGNSGNPNAPGGTGQQQGQQKGQTQSGNAENPNAAGGTNQQQGQAEAQPRAGQSGGNEARQEGASGQSAGESGSANEPGGQKQEKAAGTSGQNARSEPRETQKPAGESEETPGKQNLQAQAAPAAGVSPPPAGPEQAGAPAGQQEQNREAQATAPAVEGATAAAKANPDMQPGTEPGMADLLGQPRNAGARTGPDNKVAPTPAMTEAQQALEHQLNRVPDDPAGLLRQRFLLQHLRRNGQL